MPSIAAVLAAWPVSAVLVIDVSADENPCTYVALSDAPVVLAILNHN